MSLIENFLWLSFFQSIIVAIALFVVSGKRLVNRLLALHTLSWGLMCFYRLSAFVPKDFFRTYHYTLKFNYVVEVLMFVFIFLYIKYLSTNKKKFELIDYSHFIPALLTFIFWITYFIKPVDEKLRIFHTHGFYKPVELILFVVSITQGVVYFILSAKHIKKYHIELKENYAYTSAKTLYWMQILIGIVPLMVIMGFVGGIFGHSHTSKLIFNVLYSIIGGSIYLTSFFMFTRNSLFVNHDSILILPKPEPAESGSEYIKADKEYIYNLAENLQRIMAEDKLYLHPEINVSAVAERLNASKQDISDVLHRILNTNFFDYINKYRVEEAKRKIREDIANVYSLNSLGLDAGFNSKASFYRNFKKYENITPSEYKQLIESNLN